jgi:hypothetical protein
MRLDNFVNGTVVPPPTVWTARAKEPRTEFLRALSVTEALHCAKGSVPADVVVTWNDDNTASIAIKKTVSETCQEIICNVVLSGQLGRVIDSTKRNALDDVPTNYGRIWLSNSGRLQEIPVAVAEQSG